MKTKFFGAALLALFLFSCDDNTGSMGLDIFPDSDKSLKGNLAVFDVTTSSKLSGAVFSKTSIGYLGKFTDPYFGFYEAGFLAQLHCTDSLTFPSVYDPITNRSGVMVEDKPYSVELLLRYPKDGYFGDSLAACRLSVFQLDTDLNKQEAYYTNIDPKKYYNENDPNALLGQKVYSAVDLTISEKTRNSTDFYPQVRVTLPNELGQNILDESRKCERDGTNFANKFKEMFKGVYVQSDYGDGTILYIDAIELNVIYQCYNKDSLNNIIKKTYEKDADGNPADSIYYNARIFVATKEIIQANQFVNNKTIMDVRAQEKGWTYLKTPAGIYTQATLPLNEIDSQLSNDTINAMKLTFNNYTQNEDYNKYKYNITAPQYLLLLREQDKEEFFKDNKLPDNITSYLVLHSTSSNSYTFNNISRLVTTCLAEKKAAKEKAGSSWKEEDWIAANPNWDKVAIIPVLVSLDQNSTPISVQNDLKPGYAKLKGGDPAYGGNKLQFEVIYTSFK